MCIKVTKLKNQFKSVAITTGGSWYIYGPYGYLHADLKWRMYAEYNRKYTGWYKSRQEARETLAAWYDKVTQLED